jgi:hypothetical protein
MYFPGQNFAGRTSVVRRGFLYSWVRESDHHTAHRKAPRASQANSLAMLFAATHKQTTALFLLAFYDTQHEWR